MLCGYIRNCASYAGGEHNFRNFMKTNGLKLKNGTQVVSGTSKYYQNGVGYTEMSSKECWIHHSSRPRKPPVAEMHIFAMFFEVQLGRHGADKEERGERQSDKTENHHQNRLYLMLFDVEKVRLFIKNALWLYSELCFLCRRGARVQKNHKANC